VADLVVEGMDKLLEKLDQLTPEIKKTVGREILTATLLVEQSAKQNIARNFHGKGTLAASVKHRLEKISGLSLAGVVYSNLVYAAIHEFGGTIEPKNAKWLTIPFEGVQGRAMAYQDPFFARTLTGALVMFQKRGKDEAVPLFLLVKQVEIPARPWLNPALENNREAVVGIIGNAVKEALASVAQK